MKPTKNHAETAFHKGKQIVLSETSKRILQQRLSEYQSNRGGQNNA